MPASIKSASEKNEMHSTPSRMFRQNASRLRDLGNRPLNPMMATLSGPLIILPHPFVAGTRPQPRTACAHDHQPQQIDPPERPPGGTGQGNALSDTGTTPRWRPFSPEAAPSGFALE